MAKAKRAKISLTASLIVDGWMVDNVYLMSATDTTRVVEKHPSRISDFITSDASKALSDKDKHISVIDNPENKGGRIALHTLKCVVAFWNYQSFKGNPHAYALVSALSLDSLQRLFDVAFCGKQKSEQDYSQQRDDTRDEILQKLITARHECRIAHGGFQRTCVQFKFPANHAHNYLTLMICGMDAQKAKELEQILQGDEEIGLNHYQPYHGRALRQLAQAKRTFTWIKDDNLTLIERVDRAVMSAQRKVKR